MSKLIFLFYLCLTGFIFFTNYVTNLNCHIARSSLIPMKFPNFVCFQTPFKIIFSYIPVSNLTDITYIKYPQMPAARDCSNQN